LGKVDVNKTINNVVSFYKEVYEGKNLKVKFEFGNKDLFIYTDSSFMNEIFSQILNNAITYSANGTILLKLETETKGIIKYAVFSIKDNGIGICESKINLIFEDFRQVSEGCTREYDGLGLGLAFVKKIVELHNGEITVESKENLGSLFKIKLELKKENTKQRAF